MNNPLTQQAIARAETSLGQSHPAIYEMVRQTIQERQIQGKILVDVGCGQGQLWRYLGDRFHHYVGVDGVQFEGFPKNGTFIATNLESLPLPINSNYADLVCVVETIEHLENPRALMRELVRIVKPSGWIIVTTPNQLSLLSKLTFLFKNQFNAFQDRPGLYPAHITALLEIDLLRMAHENYLRNVAIAYSQHGRIPCMTWHYPKYFIFKDRLFSDNVLCIAQKVETTA